MCLPEDVCSILLSRRMVLPISPSVREKPVPCHVCMRETEGRVEIKTKDGREGKNARRLDPKQTTGQLFMLTWHRWWGTYHIVQQVILRSHLRANINRELCWIRNMLEFVFLCVSDMRNIIPLKSRPLGSVEAISCARINSSYESCLTYHYHCRQQIISPD